MECTYSYNKLVKTYRYGVTIKNSAHDLVKYMNVMLLKK